MEQTLYDIFDLEHNVTGAQILARYRILRDELLAEGIPYDDPQFVTLNDAYRILSDTFTRAEYDEQLKADGLYDAVERVDERTALSDLFELDDDDVTTTQHVNKLLNEDESKNQVTNTPTTTELWNQSTLPTSTRTVSRKHNIRRLKKYKQEAGLEAQFEEKEAVLPLIQDRVRLAKMTILVVFLLACVVICCLVFLEIFISTN